MGRPLLAELADFPGREEALRAIPRFHIYRRMFYRSHDAIHAHHVRWMVRFLAPLVRRHVPTLDQTRAEAIALVHDDPEIITGDAQAGNKAKMSLAELVILKQQERRAIDVLAQRFPTTVAGFSYRELLLANAEREKCPEVHLVQFADKLDAYGEALHEMLAGNTTFAELLTTEYGDLPLPTELCHAFFRRFASAYPDLAFLTTGPDAVLDLDGCADVDWLTRARPSVPHTRETLRQPTGVQPYDLWKRMILASADEEEIRRLVTKIE